MGNVLFEFHTIVLIDVIVHSVAWADPPTVELSTCLNYYAIQHVFS